MAPYGPDRESDEGGLPTSFVSSPYRRNRCRRPVADPVGVSSAGCRLRELGDALAVGVRAGRVSRGRVLLLELRQSELIALRLALLRGVFLGLSLLGVVFLVLVLRLLLLRRDALAE